MRNSLFVIAIVGACIFASGCRYESPKKPVDVTQTVTIPATRGF